MTDQSITIPRVSYAIHDENALIEQWGEHGELMQVKLHRIQIQNIAEQMGLICTNEIKRQTQILQESQSRLLWKIESYWQAICNQKNYTPENIANIREIYFNAVSVCQLLGLDPATMINPEEGEANKRNRLTRREDEFPF